MAAVGMADQYFTLVETWAIFALKPDERESVRLETEEVRDKVLVEGFTKIVVG